MNQLDWISDQQAAAPVRGWTGPNTIRPSIAEQKAELALRLGRLINTVPDSVKNGSVQVVRQWRAARDKAAKVAGSSRSSVQELESAISSMTRY